MGKDSQQRIDDALDYIQRAIPGGGFNANDASTARKAVAQWLDKNPGVKAQISQSMSIGGFRGPKMFHDADKSELRQYQRALLLIKRTLGGATNTDIQRLKATFQSASGHAAKSLIPNYKTDIRSIYSKYRDTQRQASKPRIAGEPQLAPSFEAANSLQRSVIAPAFKRSSQLLTLAHVGIMRVNLDRKEKQRFERFFSRPFNAGRHSTVKTNLKNIHNVVCARDITLYYRANDMSVHLAGDTPEFLTSIGAQAAPSTAFGYVYPNAQRPGEWHMFLGSAFFTDRPGRREGKDSMSGVYIHELSHLICGTKDHRYGFQNCVDLAAANAGQAVENADNYEYYCEDFQKNLGRFG